MTREMFLYPWDLYDEKPQAVTDQLLQMKIEGVSLAVLYHHARMLLPHNPVRKLLVHDSGSLYIPFDPGKYGPLRPNVGKAVPSGFVQDYLRHAGKNMKSVTAWAVLLHNSDLAGRHPEYALRNVFDDRSPSNLCPSNEAVWEYVLQVYRDIAESGFSGIDAESLDYAGFFHGDHHEMHAYSSVDEINRWMGICFCPSCVRKAKARGIDVPELKKQVRKAAEALLELKVAAPVDRDLLEAYEAFRCDNIAALFHEAEKAAGIPVRPIVWAAGGANPLHSGVDPVRINPSGIILCYPPSPADTAQFVRSSTDYCASTVSITGGIRLMNPQTTHAGQVLLYEEAYRAAGISRVIYYQYGMAPQPFLDQLKQQAFTAGA